MSEARQRLENELKYMPLIVMHNGKMVRVTIENYEEVTGRKLPEQFKKGARSIRAFPSPSQARHPDLICLV